MRNLLPLIYAFFLTLIITSGDRANGAERAPVQVKVKAKEFYYPGLPIIVDVEVVNVSTQPVETLQPIREPATIGARLKVEGENKYLHPSRIECYWGSNIPKTIRLEASKKAIGKLDLSRMFTNPLPPGRYIVVASYAFGKWGESKALYSEPVLINIELPKCATFEQQVELQRAMNLCSAAQILLGDGDTEQAHQLFSFAAMLHPDLEYGKVSAYYRASLEKNPKASLAAWLDYQANPAADAPELTGPEDVLRNIGRLYYKVGNFQAAKETLKKIAKPDAAVRDYLQKIGKLAAPGDPDGG